MKRLADIAEIALLIIMMGMCAMVLMAGQGNVPYIFGYRIMQVISDSMRPTIAAETCIVIEQVDDISEIKVGDVITFISEDPRIEGFHNTHRVSNIINDAETGEVLLQTKGDAHEQPDAQLVEFEQVVGRYVGELPFGDYLYRGIIFLTDRVNYFIVVIAPLFVCFMSYLKQLLVALFKPLSDYDDEKEDDEESELDKLIKGIEIEIDKDATKDISKGKDKGIDTDKNIDIEQENDECVEEQETSPNKKWWKR